MLIRPTSRRGSRAGRERQTTLSVGSLSARPQRAKPEGRRGLSSLFRGVIILSALLIVSPAFAQTAARPETQPGTNWPALRSRGVAAFRDLYGVPHINAPTERDAYYAMGYFQAQDRFFQMDLARRRGQGTQAELLGPGPNDQILETDVQIRSFGLARSAELSRALYPLEFMQLIQSYSDGVNAWLESNPLPPEYAELEITEVPRWEALDSLVIVKLICFQLTFDPSDLGNSVALSSFQSAGQAFGFDGARLFFEDIYRFSPFDPVTTIPRTPDTGAASAHSRRDASNGELAGRTPVAMSPEHLAGARRLAEWFNRNPLLKRAATGVGSNWWVVAGSKSQSGAPLLANDPHLGLGTPATFHEIQVAVAGGPGRGFNIYGVSFPGVPGIVVGHNDRMAWGATNNALDLTDFYTEEIITEDGVPQATVFRGQAEPLVAIQETFRMNQIQNGVLDDLVTISPGPRPSNLTVPETVFIVPRRNNGLLLVTGPQSGISVQFAGLSPSRELQTLFLWPHARNLDDFKGALQFFDFITQNFSYADVDGHIAYVLAGKVPLREDLEAGTIDGLPPFFLRDGTGTRRHEWVTRTDSEGHQSYEYLPFAEMPQTINPAQGFLVNANNDPLGIMRDNDPINQRRAEGQGIYYLASTFNPGFRAGKITRLLEERLNSARPAKVSFLDMQQIQSNVQLPDAEVFTPYIERALRTGRRPGAPAALVSLANDRGVREAVRRLTDWDFSAPTGIAEGYDANDPFGIRLPPTGREMAHSVAATIYTVWRSQILENTIIATLRQIGLAEAQPESDRELVDLRHLLDNFAVNRGRGASGLNFFDVPGMDLAPEDERDIIILHSVRAALDLLAGESFAPAFNRSTNQHDYRWGKLHRITFSHTFGGLAPPFSIPTAGGFRDLSPTLPGLSVDGGFETIDNGPFDVRASSANGYTFSGGPVRRYIGELRRQGVRAVDVIPGGESGVPGHPFHSNQLRLWLTNEHHPAGRGFLGLF